MSTYWVPPWWNPLSPLLSFPFSAAIAVRTRNITSLHGRRSSAWNLSYGAYTHDTKLCHMVAAVPQCAGKGTSIRSHTCTQKHSRSLVDLDLAGPISC